MRPRTALDWVAFVFLLIGLSGLYWLARVLGLGPKTER